MTAVSLAERVGQLRQRVAGAAGGRQVTVVAVTKGFGPEAVVAACGAGLDDLGESYAQELVAKAEAAPDGVRWHFVGGLQRRKVRSLAPHVHLWQSVDRSEEADEISRHAAGAKVMVQVNLTGLLDRHGCGWDAAPGLVDYVRGLGLEAVGLMGIAGQDEPRPQFRRLAALAARLELEELSMGMSGDLEVAVEEGATMVRVGRALFGPRPTPAGLRGYPSAQGGW